MHSPATNHGRAIYVRLLGMALLSYIAMFIAMYAMVHVFADVYLNINKGYMAALMVAPMIPIELGLMRAMYPDRRLNVAVAGASVALLVASFLVIRVQAGVGDDQFLRSMIPHHSSAILMCEQASIHDQEIKDLCAGIIASQQSEIDQMRSILSRLDQ